MRKKTTTEQGHAEQAFLKAAREWRATFDAIGDAISLIDIEGNILRCNSAMARLVNLPIEEIIGRHCFTLIHGSTAPIPEYPIVRMRESRQRETIEMTFGERWLRISIDPLFDEDGALVGGVHIITDLTERKRTEEKLQDSEKRFKEVMYASGDAILLIGENRFVDCNEATARMLGYGTRKECLKTHPSELSPPTQPDGQDSFQKAEEMMRLAFEQGFQRFEWMHRRANGKDFPVEVSLTPIVYEGESLLYCVWRDITNRKKAEEALRESESRYRNLFESAKDVIFIMDEDRIIDCNQPTATMFSCRREDLIGLKPYTFSPERQSGGVLSIDAGAERIRAAYAGTPQFFEWQHRRLNGEVFDAEVSLNRLELENKFFLQAIIRDVTERKKAEEALRNSEERFRSLVEHSPAGIIMVDEAFCFAYANEQICRITGYTHQELLGADFRTLLGPESIAQVSAYYLRRMAGETAPDRYEISVLRKDGTCIPAEMSVALITDSAGNKRAIGQVLDITERKRAEAALRESDERYTLAVTAVNDGIWDWNLKTGAVYFSPQWYSMLEYTPEEMPACYETFEMLIHPDDLDLTRKQVEVILDSSWGKGYDFDIRMRTKSGDWRWIKTRGKTVEFDERGKPTRFVGTHTDVTESKRVQEALKQSEQRYRQLFEQSKDPILITNEDGTIIATNEAASEVFGYTREELLATNVTPIYQDPAVRRELLQEVRRNGFVKDREVVFRTKDGSMLECLCSFTPRVDEQGETIGFQGIMKDITEQKQLEAQLLQAQKMEAIGTLAGGIAHDFNNLLTGIQGHASLMSLHLADESPLQVDIRGIETAVTRGADLTRQLLGFARGGRYEVKSIDLNAVTKSSAELFGRTRKEVRIHQKFQEGIWPVEADRGQIEQALLNLFVNAGQAMPQGGDLFLETCNVVLDEIAVKAYEAKPGRYVQLTVTDTGIGMDEETQRRIFEPFFTTKEMGRGTGLGLASAYGIMKGHGGFITVSSEKGKGSSFTLCLPASEKKLRKEVEAPVEIVKGTGTILLVDDEEIVIETGRRVLEKLGYRVVVARSGEEAIARFEEKQDEIDLVILDMIMPGMGGGEVFDRLKALDPKVKVLLSSGYSVDGQARDILSRGCQGFVQKPLTMALLSRKVHEVLHRS